MLFAKSLEGLIVTVVPEIVVEPTGTVSNVVSSLVFLMRIFPDPAWTFSLNVITRLALVLMSVASSEGLVDESVGALSSAVCSTQTIWRALSHVYSSSDCAKSDSVESGSPSLQLEVTCPTVQLSHVCVDSVISISIPVHVFAFTIDAMTVLSISKVKTPFASVVSITVVPSRR